MEIRLIVQSKRVKRRVEKDQYWYDSGTRQMFHGFGGRVDFFYDTNKRKSIPIVVDHEEWTNDNNYDDIKKWVYTRGPRFEADIVNMAMNLHITIDVPRWQFDNVYDDLRRHGITFDWDESDEND